MRNPTPVTFVVKALPPPVIITTTSGPTAGRSLTGDASCFFNLLTRGTEMCHLFRNFRCDFCGKMYTASGSLRLHLKSHLSRLAANAFSSMSLPGFNMSQNFASLAGADPLQVGQNEFKFGIKQEVFENNDASEVNDNIKDDGSGYPKENSETIRKNETVDEEH